MLWLCDGEKSLMIRVTVLTEYRRVTDGQTSCDSIVHAVCMRLTVKTETLAVSGPK